jgi:hypothetical protein
MTNTGQANGTCAPRTSTMPSLATCSGACPVGYAVCTMAGTTPVCGRTAWNFETGVPADTVSALEWNPGEAGISYQQQRAHTGTWSASILSDPNNYNASVNVWPCDLNGAAMDLRGKTYTLWLLADGPALPNGQATCSMGLFAADGSTIQVSPTIIVTVFGSWFQSTMTITSAAAAATVSDVQFQCSFGMWTGGTLYMDDVSIK